MSSDTQHSTSLLQCFLELAADRHHLPDALHLASETGRDTTELLQVPPRHLDDAVVESRLEAGRGDLGDGVGNIDETVSQCQFCRDKGEWIAGRLRSQGRRPGKARIDLDDPVLVTLRVQSKLHVTFPDHSQVANQLDRDRSKTMVVVITESL